MIFLIEILITEVIISMWFLFFKSMQDILLVLGVQPQEPLFLLNRYPRLMVKINLYHRLEQKDVQIAQDLERFEHLPKHGFNIYFKQLINIIFCLIKFS